MRVVPRDNRISRPERTKLFFQGAFYFTGSCTAEYESGKYGFTLFRPAPSNSKKKERKGAYKRMEFMTGVNKKDTVEISEILAGDFEGKTVKVNGAVHTIRDMGEVAFVVLRKREGLLQCVYEEGKTKFDLKDYRESYLPI